MGADLHAVSREECQPQNWCQTCLMSLAAGLLHVRAENTGRTERVQHHFGDVRLRDIEKQQVNHNEHPAVVELAHMTTWLKLQDVETRQ